MDADERLRANLVRLSAGQKQLAIAKSATEQGKPITQAYISAILTGRDKNPSLGKLEAIAAGLRVDILELFAPVREAGIGKKIVPIRRSRQSERASILVRPSEQKLFEQLKEIVEAERDAERRGGDDFAQRVREMLRAIKERSRPRK